MSRFWYMVRTIAGLAGPIRAFVMYIFRGFFKIMKRDGDCTCDNMEQCELVEAGSPGMTAREHISAKIAVTCSGDQI